MVGSSILPACFYNGQLYFLFGKENELADTPGWSDFGGGVEPGENELDTALREGGEELTGFLGGADQLRKLSKSVHIVKTPSYIVHIIHLSYETHKMLPEYYNNNHRFLWERMDKQLLNDTKLFEKIEVGWFTAEDMIARRGEFRNFYQEIVDKILVDKTRIRAFLRKSMGKFMGKFMGKTRKRR